MDVDSVPPRDGAAAPSPDVDEPGSPLDAAEMALHPHDAAELQATQQQMDTLQLRDEIMAIGFVVALLVVLPFLLIALWPVIPSTSIKVALVGGAAVLALYNGGSIFKLIQNYRRDSDFIYRRDVAHLRELKEIRRELKATRLVDRPAP